MDLEKALEEATAELAAAEKQVAAAVEHANALRTEVQGLRLAKARAARESERKRKRRRDAASSVLQGAGTSLAAVADQQSRTEAIVTVLTQADRALSPSEILAELKALGRVTDEVHVVSATLSHLKSQQRVASLGRGQWVLTAGQDALGDGR